MKKMLCLLICLMMVGQAACAEAVEFVSGEGGALSMVRIKLDPGDSVSYSMGDVLIGMVGGGFYDQYARYGLGYEPKDYVLYYMGERVRIFDDERTSGGLELYDQRGTIDVRSVLKYNDPIGLEALSDAEFAARDLSDWSKGRRALNLADGYGLGLNGWMYMEGAEGVDVNTIEVSEMMKAQQLTYAPYLSYGLSYDSMNNLIYYMGRPVRYFFDAMNTDQAENPRGANGEIDVFAVRDGDELIGLSVVEVE